MAYLMARGGLALAAARSVVKAARPFIHPNQVRLSTARCGTARRAGAVPRRCLIATDRLSAETLPRASLAPVAWQGAVNDGLHLAQHCSVVVAGTCPALLNPHAGPVSPSCSEGLGPSKLARCPVCLPRQGFLAQLRLWGEAGCSAEGWQPWSLIRFLEATEGWAD